MDGPEADLPIRLLAEDDLDELLDLYRQFGHDDDPPVPRARVASTWREILASGFVVHLGLFEGKRLLTTAHASVTPNLTRGARPYAVIENVVTRDGWRRRGLGTRLMRALIAACWDRGCYKIMLLSGAHRPEAHRFYQQLGFAADAKRGFVIRR